MSDGITLDEFLAKGAEIVCLATVEPVADKPNLVRITPWARQGGCQCHLALEIPKNVIESVRPTGDFHPCCEKVLRVVDVRFKRDGTIPVSEVFAQVIAKAIRQHGGSAHPFESAGGEALKGVAFPANPIAPSLGHYPGREYIQRVSVTAFNCPPGSSPISCPGTGVHCAPNGSFCCGYGFCGPGQMCINCPGLDGPRCAPAGSFCCGYGYCGPGQICLNCPGLDGPRCAPVGSHC